MAIFSNSLGKRIRTLRKERGLTLVQLARVCNCSPSLISQIETGTVNPSLNIIHTIADAFHVPLVEIVTEIDSPDPPRAENAFWTLSEPDKRKAMTLQNGGVHFELLSKGLRMPFEFVLCVYPPGASSGDDLQSHEGEECGYLLEGELDVQINDHLF
ncbi:MAG: helix-turn-helix domain-containing protein, partial [Deltaproteobacteria bacterium]|nr:helix-turn-helix domain-containing protein [Deltaproteobacteria bacterium]